MIVGVCVLDRGHAWLLGLLLSSAALARGADCR